ncbi:DUF4752 family protein [Enterobacter soli]|uniref:DUF4752 family protein n=1 Tax=Enterobacter soli TaxID=885040 RepID=UPI003ED9892E
MDAFKNYSITDWFFFTTTILIWLYIAVKAFRWVLLFLIRFGWRWWNREDDKTLALDSFYEAFKLGDIKPGQGIVITTESGMTIHIRRPKGEQNA